MKLKIRNETKWATRDLRRFLTQCAKNESLREAEHLSPRGAWGGVVTVKFMVSNRVHGRAAIRGYWANLWLPVPTSVEAGNLLKRELAYVLQHELAHVRGAQHGAMGYINHRWPSSAPDDEWAWADGFALRAPALAPKPKLTPDEKRAAKLEHARTMREEWERRLRRAQGAVKKWTRRARALERAAAAKKPPELPVPTVGEWFEARKPK